MNRSTNIRSTLFLLAIILPASVVSAQVVTTSLVVSPKVMVENYSPFALEPHLDFDTGTLMLRGIKVWKITAHENLMVNARVSHAGKLVNQAGHRLPLSTWISYRNDGGNHQEPLSQWQNSHTQFAMSNSCLIIQSMRPNPNLHSAFLFLEAVIDHPQSAHTTYVESIYVHLEFN